MVKDVRLQLLSIEEVGNSGHSVTQNRINTDKLSLNFGPDIIWCLLPVSNNLVINEMGIPAQRYSNAYKYLPVVQRSGIFPILQVQELLPDQTQRFCRI